MRNRESGFEGSGGDSAPVNVGDEFNVKIEAVGEKGDGIAKKDGFVLFVPNTKEGETVKIRVTKVLRKVGFAEVTGRSDKAGEQAENQGGHRDLTQDADPEEEPAENKEDTEDFGEEPELPEPPEEEREYVEEQTEEAENK